MAKPPAKNSDQDVIAAIEPLLSSYEARVLGAIGLFVGYLCVFLTKLMNFTEPYVGVIGVVGLTTLLLFLSRQVELKSPHWWMRSLAVVILAIILTSPQLYFAWTVSVEEARANALKTQAVDRQRLEAFAKPQLNIGPPK